MTPASTIECRIAANNHKQRALSNNADPEKSPLDAARNRFIAMHRILSRPQPPQPFLFHWKTWPGSFWKLERPHRGQQRRTVEEEDGARVGVRRGEQVEKATAAGLGILVDGSGKGVVGVTGCRVQLYQYPTRCCERGLCCCMTRVYVRLCASVRGCAAHLVACWPSGR